MGHLDSPRGWVQEEDVPPRPPAESVESLSFRRPIYNIILVTDMQENLIIATYMHKEQNYLTVIRANLLMFGHNSNKSCNDVLNQLK